MANHRWARAQRPVLWDFSQGFQPAAGKNFGAKQYGRVKQITKAFIAGAAILSLIFYVPIELVSLGAADFRILFETYILLGFILMTITLMQALGEASKASVLVLLRQIGLFVPLVLLMPKIGGLGSMVCLLPRPRPS